MQAISHQVSVPLQLKRPLSSCTSRLSTLPFTSSSSDHLHFVMVAKHTSSAISAGTMRATLVLLLLLGAVVAAQARPVSCENKCQKPIVVNGVTVDAYATAIVEVADVVKLEVVDATNVHLFGSYSCPADVTGLVLVYEDGCVQVKVAVVGIISKLLHTVVGLVLGLIECVL